jgi:hypothetical protein
MQAKLVTYKTDKLNNSEKSILSKRLYGYTDKSNMSKYTYDRKGLLQDKKHIKICNNTFIIIPEEWESIKKELKKRKVTITEWDITIEQF